MTKQRHLWWMAGSIVALSSSTACSRAVELEPANPAQHVGGLEEAAQEEHNGVQVTALTDAWQGREQIRHEVTPLRLIIENEGDKPVALQFRNFSLVASDGKKYAALPPMKIEGEIADSRVVMGPVSPTWTARGFDVAPYYSASTYGAHAPVGVGPFALDYSYYDTYYPSWDGLELPTTEMLQAALPEGTLKPGGRVDGFLYFEKVSSDVDRVVLNASLVAPDKGEQIAAVSLPFEVDD